MDELWLDNIGKCRLLVMTTQRKEINNNLGIVETSLPTMLDDDLNMKFVMNLTEFDPWKYIKVRILCPEDFGTVDWATGELINPEREPVFYDAVVLHFHGGGFMLGSSGESQPITIRLAKDTGLPIFSVDYRLAPLFKFPIGISDCWIVYLWLIKYCEKYLNLKFRKILLAGESAGSNIALGKFWIKTHRFYRCNFISNPKERTNPRRPVPNLPTLIHRYQKLLPLLVIRTRWHIPKRVVPLPLPWLLRHPRNNGNSAFSPLSKVHAH